MGLYKERTLDNGVPVSYHRIDDVMIRVNQGIAIRTSSYVNVDQRKRELGDRGVYNSVDMGHYEMPYKENATISDMYAFLKTLPDFEGAEDVFEEDDEN